MLRCCASSPCGTAASLRATAPLSGIARKPWQQTRPSAVFWRAEPTICPRELIVPGSNIQQAIPIHRRSFERSSREHSRRWGNRRAGRCGAAKFQCAPAPRSQASRICYFIFDLLIYKSHDLTPRFASIQSSFLAAPRCFQISRRECSPRSEPPPPCPAPRSG